MIKAILIDDEKNALEMLEWQLQNYCPQVEIAATCNSADKGIAAIRQHQPQVVFLDIEMPKKNGFEVLQQFPNPGFEVIFTTAYNQFALKAFRVAALDYLLKPIDANDLVAAVARLENRDRNNHFQEQLDIIIRQFRQPNQVPEKICVSTLEAVHFINPENILYCQSSSNYTNLLFVDGSKMLVSKPLKEVEEMLSGFRFLRIHHSYAINLKYVTRYVKADGGAVEMTNGDLLPVSRQIKDRIVDLLMNRM